MADPNTLLITNLEFTLKLFPTDIHRNNCEATSDPIDALRPLGRQAVSQLQVHNVQSALDF